MTIMQRRLSFYICLLMGVTYACSSNQKGTGTPPGRPAAEQRGGLANTPKSDVSAVNVPGTGPSDARPQIVTFGDSISAGYGADPGKSYPDYLQKRIDAANLNYHVFNAGVSGDTTTDGLERLPGVLAMKPKIVILELGGNDGLRVLPPATTKANLEKMITAIQGAGSKVVLAGITLPRNYGPTYIHQFEQIYVQLADQYHLTRIPFILKNVATDKKLMQPDGIHPTADGNKLVADTVFDAIKPLLNQSVKDLKQ